MRRRRQKPQNFKSYESALLDGAAEYMNANSLLTGGIESDVAGSISLWVKPVDGTPTGTEEFIAFGDTNAVEFIQFQIQTDGDFSININDAGTAQSAVSTTDAGLFADNTWAHIAVTQDATSAAPILYKGAIKPTQSNIIFLDNSKWISALTGLDNLRIGSRNYNSGGETSHFNGNVKDVAVWNINLSQAEITELYSGGAKPDYKKHSKSANLVSWYTMDNWSWDGTNFTIYDEMGNNDITSSAFEFADMEVDNPY